MHFSRKTILVVGAAMLAACGDKVSVVQYTPPPTTAPVLKVNSVDVAPLTATLTIGQAITLTAAVNADVGVATTVSWSASAANVTVTSAGVVTAVTATPGVAVCATSTVDAGKKGCATIVVSAVVPPVGASISINSITQTGTTNTVNPSNVTGNIDITLNVNPGNQTVSKIVLLVGGVRQDSQMFSAAQSAALRYAGDQAVAAQSTFPQVMFTVNTAGYNATTGVANYANGNKAISAQLYVAGTTSAASTATAASNLAFNNTDAVYGTWTLPTTNVKAADALGYQWVSLGGGNLVLNVTPVIYSGKTASSVTVKYTNFNNTAKVSCASRITAGTSGACFSATAFGDTASVKTLTTFPATATFALFDRDMIRGGGDVNVVTPLVPTFNIIFTDGSSLSDANLTAPAGTTLALRIDNVAPADLTVSAPIRGSATVLRTADSWNARPGTTLTDADSSSMITAIGADNGVSNGAVFNGDLRGTNWKVFTSAGSTTTTDSSNVGTTAITTAASLTEANYYCVRVQSFDKLGNGSLYPDATIKSGAQTTTTCPAFGKQTRGTTVDNTAPVDAFAGVANGDFSVSDTAFTAGFGAGVLNYFYNVTDNNNLTDSVSVCYYQNVSNVMTAAEYIGGAAATACSRRVAGTGTGTNKAIQTATAQFNQITSAGTLGGNPGQIVISVQSYDKAGNTGNRVSRVVLWDAGVPTVTAASSPAVLLGDAPAVSSFINDGMSISNYALELGNNTSFAYASNIAFAVGTVTNGESGAKAPIFRSAYTASGDLISTVPLTKFLNVVGSATAPAFQYLTQYNAAAVGGSVSEQTDALLAASVGYRFLALDQVGNRSLGGTLAVPTISNTFALTGAATSPISGASGAITSVGVDAGFTYSTDYAATTSAIGGSRVASSTLRLKVTYYPKHDQTSTFWNNKVSATGWVYCSGRTAATGGSPLMNGASAVSESVGIQSVTAPSVSLYAPVTAGATNQSTLEFVGNATLLSSATVPGTPKNSCGDLITNTYSITFTATNRAFPLPNYRGGSVVFVVRHGGGFATFFPIGIAVSQ